MNSELDQSLVAVVVRFHDEDGLSVEEIVEGLGIDKAIVEMVLARHSAEYRLAKAGEGEGKKVYELVDDVTWRKLQKSYITLAFAEDTPVHVRERAQRFLIDEKKGRNDARAELPAVSSVLLSLNKEMKRMESRKRAALDALKPKPRMIEAEVVVEPVKSNGHVETKP